MLSSGARVSLRDLPVVDPILLLGNVKRNSVAFSPSHSKFSLVTNSVLIFWGVVGACQVLLLVFSLVC